MKIVLISIAAIAAIVIWHAIAVLLEGKGKKD